VEQHWVVLVSLAAYVACGTSPGLAAGLGSARRVGMPSAKDASRPGPPESSGGCLRDRAPSVPLARGAPGPPA